MDEKIIPVKVALRTRPLVNKERNEGCQMCIKFIPNEPQIIVGTDKSFRFDFVFSPTSNQSSVYESVVKPLVSDIFKGYNATVLAYGQTGSGKTYSMGTVYDSDILQNDNVVGIIPRTIRDIFSRIEETDSTSFIVKVTFLEIYNEDVLDLLNSKQKNREEIAIREDNGEIKVTNLNEVTVTSLYETLKCLEQGSLCRTTGATAMNLASSRSHAIFTIHIEQKNSDTCVRSKFHLVDLAGSERAKKTRAQGERFKEGVNINRGLLALGNVISALCEEKNRSHVPYRDSKLTRLLQDSLGGNSHTAMIACISPADSNMEETVNTLRYADRARKIKNKPIVNMDPQGAELALLKQQIQQLQLQVASSSGGENNSNNTQVITELENRVRKLTRELQNALHQSAMMSEKAILAEAARDHLKKKLAELVAKTGVSMDCLSQSINMNANPQLLEHYDVVREVHEKIVDLQAEQKKTIDELLSIEASGIEHDLNDSGNGESPCDPFTTEYTLKQAERNRELQDLNRALVLKEDLMNKLESSDDKYNVMKQQYEDTKREYEEQIAILQREKEQWLQNTASSKLSEQRRKRLQELENEIGTLRKKVAEQNRLAKLKEQTDLKVNSLHQEIQAMKQVRVKLIRQMREEGDKYRQLKQEKDREVARLKQQDRRRQYEIVRMEQTHSKQQTVLRRKMEEALVANKRLKEALALRKSVADKRNQNKDQQSKQNATNRIQSWLKQELEVVVSSKEAAHCLQFLLEDRKSISEELNRLRKELELVEPPKKKIAWEHESEQHADSSDAETDLLRGRITLLENEQELRTAQIADLQQKIIDADQEEKISHRWDTLQNMAEAKNAMQWLFETVVNDKVETTVKGGECRDVKVQLEEAMNSLQDKNRELRRLKQAHDEEKVRLERESEEKILFLLRQLPKIGGVAEEEPATIDQLLRERLKFQEEQTENLSRIYDEFDKKVSECDDLRRQLTLSHCKGGKVTLMPKLIDFSGSPVFTRTPQQPQKKRLNSKRALHPVSTNTLYDNFEEEEEVDDDDDVDQDPDWKLTPWKETEGSDDDVKKTKFRKPKLSNNSKCSCKGNCSAKLCSCRKGGRVCSESCRCSKDKCKNLSQEQLETSQDTDGNSTFSISSTEYSKLSISSENKENPDDAFLSPNHRRINLNETKERRRTKLFNSNRNIIMSDDED